MSDSIGCGIGALRADAGWATLCVSDAGWGRCVLMRDEGASHRCKMQDTGYLASWILDLCEAHASRILHQTFPFFRYPRTP